MSTATLPTARARRLHRAWIAGAVAYSLVRIVVVRQALGSYGVNVPLYAAVDLGSTLPYAYATSRAVQAFAARQRSTARRWALLASVAFVLPDLTLVLTAGRLPTFAYAVLATVLVTAAATAVIDGRRRLLAVRRG